MRNLFVAVLLASSVASIGVANAHRRMRPRLPSNIAGCMRRRWLGYRRPCMERVPCRSSAPPPMRRRLCVEPSLQGLFPALRGRDRLPIRPNVGTFSSRKPCRWTVAPYQRAGPDQAIGLRWPRSSGCIYL